MDSILQVNSFAICNNKRRITCTESPNLPASIDGGDGTSGQVGWSGTGFFAMSALEVLQYGSDFFDRTCCKYMLLWEYDGEEKWSDVDETIGADYFNAEEDYKDSTLTLTSTEECMCLDGEK